MMPRRQGGALDERPPRPDPDRRLTDRSAGTTWPSSEGEVAVTPGTRADELLLPGLTVIVELVLRTEL